MTEDILRSYVLPTKSSSARHGSHVEEEAVVSDDEYAAESLLPSDDDEFPNVYTSASAESLYVGTSRSSLSKEFFREKASSFTSDQKPSVTGESRTKVVVSK